MQSRWEQVKGSMKNVDIILEEVQSDTKGQQLRDSISSMLSNDRSTIGSGNVTPGSSPPSSVVMSSLGLETVTPSGKNKGRSASGGVSSLPKPTSARRGSSLAPPSRRPPANRLSMLSAASSSLSTPPQSGSSTPQATRLPRSSSSMADHRPRWNASTNTNDSDVGHNFKPLTLTTPSPYATKSPSPGTSKLPMRSSFGRASSSSPIPEDTPPRKSASSRLSFRDRIAAASPGPHAQQSIARNRMSMQASTSCMDNRRSSLQPPEVRQRPASSLATGSSRRTSLLPQPRAKENSSGRQSPYVGTRARTPLRMGSSSSSTAETKPKDNKPRWHF